MDRLPRAVVLFPTLSLLACGHVGRLVAGDRTVPSHGSHLRIHVAGHGPPCIVHSGGPGVEWSYLRMPEVERFLTLVYVEPIGTGASGRLASRAAYTYARYVGDVDAVRESLGVDRVCLLGHSAGGFVALKYAIARPDHLSALILYDTAPALDASWRREVRENLRWFEDRSWYHDAVTAFDSRRTAKTDPEMTAIWRSAFRLLFADWDRLDPALQVQVQSVRAWVTPSVTNEPRFDVRAELRTIHVPTLVVVGRRDFITPVSSADAIHEGIVGSRLVVLEHSGHMGHIEEPEAFARAIADLVPAFAGD